MANKIVTGQDLERWRFDHGLYVQTAAECFGIQRKRWEDLVRSDEIITDARLLNLYYLYTTYPNTIPVPPSFDYVSLFKELGFESTTRDKKSFARLFGLSVTGAYRMLDNFSMGRDVESYAQGLKRTGLKGKQLLQLMTSIRRLTDQTIEENEEAILARKKRSAIEIKEEQPTSPGDKDK